MQGLLLRRDVRVPLGVHEGRQMGRQLLANEVLVGWEQLALVHAVEQPLWLNVVPRDVLCCQAGAVHDLMRNRLIAFVKSGSGENGRVPGDLAAERSDDNDQRFTRYFAVNEELQALEERTQAGHLLGLLLHFYDALRVAILLQQFHVDVQLLLVLLHLVRAEQLEVERCDAVGHEAALVLERVLVVLQHIGGELWWIGQVQAVEQAEVGEAQHNGVELDEN